MIQDLCAYYYGLPVIVITLILLIFSIFVTVQNKNLVPVSSYVIAINTPTPSPYSTAPPTSTIYKHTILYTYNNTQYQIDLDMYFVHPNGQPLPIYINKKKPTEVYASNSNVLLWILWSFTCLFGIFAIFNIVMLQSPEGRKTLCTGNLLWRFFS